MATLHQNAFPPSEIVNCPHCKKDITLHDPAGSDFCVCPNCNSYLSFKSNDHPVVRKNVPEPKNKPIIPLGTEGILKDFRFRIIAYFEKKEKGTKYTWSEYLLYNYEKGYATLSVFNGHWNFIVDKNWEPSLATTFSDSVTATHDDIEYRLFNKYTPVTTAIVGEFDWDVLSDHPKTNEYIAPPFILSRESGSTGNAKAEYFWGEYIEPEELASSFGLDISVFPTKEGIGANQPSSHWIGFGLLAKYTMLAFLILFIISFLIKECKPERELLNSSYEINFGKEQAYADSLAVATFNSGSYEYKPFLSSSFVQPEAQSVLEIEVSSYVDNSWLEATVILVNEGTNETWEVTKGVEYYHGYEDGEYWTEGSRNETMILSEIPAGRYHLNIYPASGDAKQTSLSLSVKSNITLWRNILLTLLVLSLYPFYIWFRSGNFERKRWMNSNYSPYDNE